MRSGAGGGRSTSIDASTYRLDRRVAAAFVALMVTMLLPAMNLTVLAPVLPAIGRDLGGDGQLPIVVTAHLLASTVVAPITGQISDAVGRKPLLLVAVGVFVVGSALAGLAPSIETLIAARAFQGVGGGAIPVLVYATVAELVPPRARGRYQGFTTLAFAVASVAGPPLGGLFADSDLWRWVFFLNVPVGGAALVAIRVLLPATEAPERPEVDIRGAVTLTVGTSSLVLLSIWGGTRYAWTSPVSLALASATIVCGALLVTTSARIRSPILPLGLLRERNFGAAVAAAFATQAAFNSALLCAPLLLQAVIGTTAALSGVLLLPLVFGVFLSSVFSGQVIAKTGRYRRFPLLGTAMGAIAFAILGLLGVRADEGAVTALMGVVGTGVGMTTVVLVLASQNAVPHHLLGAATSTIQFARMLGATVGVAVCGSVLSAGLSPLGPRLSQIDEVNGPDQLLGDPALVRALRDDLRAMFEDRLASHLMVLFLISAGSMALACASTYVLRDVPLRDDVDTDPPTTAAPA